MSLPTSRNTTYAADAPVKSVDLNDIQDCIVADKHAETEIGIPAAGFVIKTATATLDDGEWTFTSAATLIAQISVPVGARITTIAWAYNRGNLGTLTLKLRRRNLATGAAAADVASATDNTGNAWEVNTQTYNHVVAAGYAYWLEFSNDNGAAPTKLGGVNLKHDKL